MLGHIGIGVPDLVTAKAYYDQIMPLVGFEVFSASEDHFSYRPGGQPGTPIFFYPALDSGTYSRHRSGLQHLAFFMPMRSAVRAVHRRVAEMGSDVVHEPQEFRQYGPHHFATFWLDPHGFMLEAVCHYDRE